MEIYNLKGDLNCAIDNKGDSKLKRGKRFVCFIGVGGKGKGGVGF